MNMITVIDFETTGMEPPEAEVCEVGYTIIDGNRINSSDGRLCGVKSMPPEVRAVHGIRMEDVAGCEPFNADDLPFSDYYAAHNADFEARFLPAGIKIICTYKAALRVWPESKSHSNGYLRYWLEDQGLISPIHELTQPPHRAVPDSYTTAHILLALLKNVSIEDMLRWSSEPRLLPRCPIGKHKGKQWSEIDSSYLQWMIGQADMDTDLKWNARRELEARK